jgi:hypothetical protein
MALCAVGDRGGLKKIFLMTASPDARTVPAARARGSFMPILCLAAKNRRRKGTKGFPLEPMCATKLLTLPRHQCFVVDKKIQLLRWRFDNKTPTGKTHATSKSKSFCHLRRALVCTNFKQNGMAKILARPLPAQTPPTRLPRVGCQGSSKRERLGAFLGHFLGRTKKCQ